MKKIFTTSLFVVTTSLFAQDVMPTSLSQDMASISNNLGFDIIGILIGVFFYFLLPALLYCISSYSLSLLSKHYHKKSSSKISWIPFVRYYDFVKQATKSPKKAFFITLFPWIVAATGLAGVIIMGMQDIIVSGATPLLVTFASIFGIGVLSIVGMNFWRAFIIAKYVGGDTTSALGLSTYTSLVLWYIALDRVYKNTNIIGIIGFVAIGLVICFYIGIIAFAGFAGVEAFLNN